MDVLGWLIRALSLLALVVMGAGLLVYWHTVLTCQGAACVAPGAASVVAIAASAAFALVPWLLGVLDWAIGRSRPHASAGGWLLFSPLLPVALYIVADYTALRAVALNHTYSAVGVLLLALAAVPLLALRYASGRPAHIR